MTDTAEFRHILSLVQSHLDSHDVLLEDLEYELQNYVEEDDFDQRNGVPSLRVTGSTVRLEVEYSFGHDE